MISLSNSQERSIGYNHWSDNDHIWMIIQLCIQNLHMVIPKLTIYYPISMIFWEIPFFHFFLLLESQINDRLPKCKYGWWKAPLKCHLATLMFHWVTCNHTLLNTRQVLSFCYKYFNIFRLCHNVIPYQGNSYTNPFHIQAKTYETLNNVTQRSCLVCATLRGMSPRNFKFRKWNKRNNKLLLLNKSLIGPNGSS